ncbi:hypothetical protein K0B96_04630 [Horticoccus luteus]|uniref:Uncharacterized protein n=1 Tax=Horticoccus luteus TaxID=2862869 RepID=A0A8F9TY59_9BACT|nr:hypothetical protein [Horticoccus luteus]QYM79908.1 hypothetical protein K0B96_04630 [Horticoccus luteus]
MICPSFASTPVVRFRPLLWALGCLAIVSAASAAAPNRAPLGEQESVTVTAAQGDDAAATVTFQLRADRFGGHAPAKGEFTILSEKYIWWSHEMTVETTGDHVQASVPLAPAGMDALLIAENSVAAFPGGPENVAEVTVPRAAIVPQLASIMPPEGHAIFFNPQRPAPPAVPAADAPLDSVNAYVRAVTTWDADMQSTLSSLATELVRAQSLFTDLRTAGRLPWKPDQLKQLAARYQQTPPEQKEFEQLRSSTREQAQNYVQQWNAAHASKAGATAATLPFPADK